MSPLDVLSVMQDGIADYTESGHEGLASDMTEAHNAVAELIEAVSDVYVGPLAEPCPEVPQCPSCRIQSALARVTGGAQ